MCKMNGKPEPAGMTTVNLEHIKKLFAQLLGHKYTITEVIRTALPATIHAHKAFDVSNLQASREEMHTMRM